MPPKRQSRTRSSSKTRKANATTTATTTAAAVSGRKAGSLFFLYASLAGACGALSGVVGKVAVAAAVAPQIAAFALSTAASSPLFSSLIGGAGHGGGDGGDEAAAAVARLTFYVEMGFRVAFFFLNAFLTGQMWRFFLKSLSLGPTPVASIINTGTNFAVSAFLGLVFFREEVNATWAAGALCIVVGLTLVTDPAAAKVTG